MKLIKFNSIRSRLTFWFLLLSLGPLLIAIILTFSQQTKSIELRAYDKLTAIRDLKAQQLNNWLNERLGDIDVMAADNEIRNLEDIFIKTDYETSDLKKIAASRAILLRYHQNFHDYEEIFIIDAKTGFIILSTQQESEGENKTFDPYFSNPLKTGKAYNKGIYYSETLRTQQMTLSVPIYCLEQNKHIIGVLVARIDLDNSLYHLIENRVGLGESGETLLVNSDVVAINELRHYENAPLNLKIKAEPAVRAAAGETGIVKTQDYRGTEVLAAYTYISQTGWGFICKQDMYELKAPIRQLLNKYLILYFISILVVALIVFWIIKLISKPILDMNYATQRIKEGDFTVRTHVSSRDELGELANSIDEMASSIESINIVQKGVADISGKMLGLISIQEFAEGLLGELMQISKANMATFYILNEANSQFEHFASVGANEKLLKSFSSKYSEGEIGYAISKKDIVYLQEIPDDTPFQFNTIAGNLAPKEIITIPIMIEKSVVAIISLVNIHKFKKDSYTILKQSWTSINTSYSNLLANERTRILAEGLSRSNQKLEAQSEELQEQSEELMEQATELQRSSEDLQSQNLELEIQRNQVEEANRLKSEFLSNMSHELRTPLNSINALSQVLIKTTNNKLDEDESNYLQIIERNGKRLLSLINDILDLSKIEAGKMDINPKAVSLPSLLNSLIESMSAIAENKGIVINLQVDENISIIETDETRLYQVLLNILGNAVKFTDKGSVTIHAKQEKENIKVSITDTGIGIPDEMIPFIFDEFRQADGSSSRQYEGTGLGLAIARKLINILGGKINAKSNFGNGSVFSITIPINWVEKFPDKFAGDSNEHDEYQLKKTILVVEDDPEIAKEISRFLTELGYNTITANSGLEAIKMAERYRPFAITLDVIMPEMDGWEVLEKIKNKEKTKNIPVIIISVSDDKETGFALGAVGFINKPVKKDQLLSEITKLYDKPDSIMIVDDNELELKQLADIIKAQNIHTILANNGADTIKLLEKSLPDVLILDLLMPEMDGFQVIDKIRSKPDTKNLPIIVVTAKDITENDKKQLEGKVSAMIAKSENTPYILFTEIARILKDLEEIQQRFDAGNSDEKKRILLVEDNTDAITQINSILKNENFFLDVAIGGQEALNYIQHTIPDGIILDLMMPDVDGFDFLEKIRSKEMTKNIPVLILTAKDLTREDLSRLSANNVQQLIHKGDIDVDGLIFRLGLMMGKGINNSSDRSNENLYQTKDLHNYRKPGMDGSVGNLLVIEDNEDNMATIQAILKGKYNILEAFDGEQGLSIARSQKPDLILLDLSLPKISGEALLKILKEEINTQNIPVIVVTAQVMKGTKERVLKLGCDSYVGKPIDPETLLMEIRRFLK